jgi:hypothetical protein
MADETHEEDLSQLEGDAVIDRVRALMDEGWQPSGLTLHRPEESRTSEPTVLRDEPRI